MHLTEANFSFTASELQPILNLIEQHLDGCECEETNYLYCQYGPFLRKVAPDLYEKIERDWLRSEISHQKAIQSAVEKNKPLMEKVEKHIAKLKREHTCCDLWVTNYAQEEDGSYWGNVQLVCRGTDDIIEFDPYELDEIENLESDYILFSEGGNDYHLELGRFLDGEYFDFLVVLDNYKSWDGETPFDDLIIVGVKL